MHAMHSSADTIDALAVVEGMHRRRRDSDALAGRRSWFRALDFRVEAVSTQLRYGSGGRYCIGKPSPLAHPTECIDLDDEGALTWAMCGKLGV